MNPADSETPPRPPARRFDGIRTILEKGFLSPIAETAWVRWRNRAAWTAIGIGVALAVQTAIVYSPASLIRALYNGREANLQTLRRMAPAEQEKLLQTLCFALRYYQRGDHRNPNLFPESDDCQKIHALRN